MIPITRMIQTADTLRYLYLGGRIGRAKQLLGSLLNIKPLIGMDDGVIVPLGQARSLGRAYQMMVERVEAAVGRMGKIKVAYVHTRREAGSRATEGPGGGADHLCGIADHRALPGARRPHRAGDERSVLLSVEG